MTIIRGVNTNVKNLVPFLGKEIHHTVDAALTWARNKIHEPYVLVVHPPQGETPISVLNKLSSNGGDQTVWDTCYQHLRGVLFIKQVAYCAIGKDDAVTLMQKHGGRVHVISYSVPPLNQTDATYLRFVAFKNALSLLSPDARIPWHLLEPPPWPEEAVAVYLALIAKTREVDDVLRQCIADETWEKANKQMEELSEAHGPCAWEGFDLGNPEKNVAKLDAMRRVFAKVAEEQRN